AGPVRESHFPYLSEKKGGYFVQRSAFETRQSDPLAFLFDPPEEGAVVDFSFQFDHVIFSWLFSHCLPLPLWPSADRGPFGMRWHLPYVPDKWRRNWNNRKSPAWPQNTNNPFWAPPGRHRGSAGRVCR